MKVVKVIYNSKTSKSSIFPNSNSNIFVNAPCFDCLTHGVEEADVFLGGHPAKYWPPTIVCAVCEFLCTALSDYRYRVPSHELGYYFSPVNIFLR